jgi:hypothetical protein
MNHRPFFVSPAQDFSIPFLGKCLSGIKKIAAREKSFPRCAADSSLPSRRAGLPPLGESGTTHLSPFQPADNPLCRQTVNQLTNG